MLYFHKTGEFGLWFIFLVQLFWKLCQRQDGKLGVLLQVSRTKPLSVPGPGSLSLIQLYSALLTAMQTHADSFGKLTAQYNQPSYLMHSVPVKNKELWCMLTTRVNGSLSSALQTSPKENVTHCSGTFFNHPLYTEVGEFRCDERKKNIILFHCHKFMKFGGSILRSV